MFINAEETVRIWLINTEDLVLVVVTFTAQPKSMQLAAGGSVTFVVCVPKNVKMNFVPHQDA